MRASIPALSSNVSRLLWGAAVGVDHQFVFPQKKKWQCPRCCVQLSVLEAVLSFSVRQHPCNPDWCIFWCLWGFWLSARPLICPCILKTSQLSVQAQISMCGGPTSPRSPVASAAFLRRPSSSSHLSQPRSRQLTAQSH